MAKTAEDVSPQQAEIMQLIGECAVLKDRQDALEEMTKQRKDRILVLMRAEGASKIKAPAGEAAFTARRSFKVHDPKRLAKMMTKVQLASLVKITADVYDACVAEEKPIDEAVTVGKSESLSVSRSRTKVAKERRVQHIAESKRQAEKRITAFRKQLRA